MVTKRTRLGGAGTQTAALGAGGYSNPPNSPSGGDLWWDSDVGELYIYYSDTDSNQWVETSGGSETVTVSDNAPSSPNHGDLWWESDTGRLKIYYQDTDTTQWVDTTPPLSSLVSSDIPGSATATGTAGAIRFDSGYVYICVATDTWKRAALTTW